MAEKKLLVADDSLTIQKVIRLALSNEGYQIEAVSEGKEASQQIPLFRPDIVLIDVSLPGKSAFEIREEFGPDSEFAQIQFILMSSAFEQVDEERVAQLQFQGRLIKPFDPAHLRKVLEEVSPPDRETKTISPPMPPPPPPALSSKGSGPRLTPPPPPPAPAAVTEENSNLKPDLWEDEADSAALEPEGQSAAKDEDIKGLTEETIKMSGLDGFEWQMEEKAKRDTQETPGTPREIGEDTLAGFQVHEPALEPSKNSTDTEGVTLNFTDRSGHSIDPASIYHNAPDQFQEPSDLKIVHNDEIDLESAPLEPPSSPERQSAVPLTTREMEELISTQLEKSLEKMAEKLLPRLAEKIIREEIHKMLTHPPE